MINTTCYRAFFRWIILNKMQNCFFVIDMLAVHTVKGEKTVKRLAADNNR